MTTLLVTPAELKAEEVTVEGDAYRHLFRAKRLAVGDPVRVVDGAGQARHGKIEEVSRREARLALGAPAPSLESEVQVELWVAPIRHQRASWLVEKATELGVTAVRFLQSERVSHELTPDTEARLHRMAAAALQQCGRSRLPRIDGPHSWGDLETLLAGVERAVVLDPQGPPLARSALVAETERRWAVFIGPEGGWTDAEVGELRQRSCQPFSLGPRILRTETAALAAAALVLAGS